MSDSFSNKEIKGLLEMLAKHDVTECRIERGEDKLILKRGESKAAASEFSATQPSSIHQVFGAYPTSGGSYPSALSAEDQGAALDAHVQSQAHDTVGRENAAPVTAEPSVVAAAPEPVKSNLTDIPSPMVGTFYRKPAVDSPPYVSVGDVVSKGQVLCILEAMKLMNEIECEQSGRIAEVCLEDGQMVEYGEVLFRIEPL